MSVIDTTPATGFDRFELKTPLMRGIAAAGFKTPRPIQDETIPAGRAGRDVLGLAHTGTGKTAAFALPMMDRLLESPGRGPRALVIAPTRELATQIAEEIASLARFTRLRTVTIFGGVSINNQIRALRAEPDIVVGCPGRMLDLLGQRVLHLDAVETLVLDEADHMFDMGFLPDIRKILKKLPTRRQNLLFSATMPKEIRHLADDVLRNPHVVDLAGAAPADTIDHGLYLVEESRKRDLLEHVLTSEDCTSAIIFSRTKHRVKRLARQLSESGHRVVGLQGNMSQPQRDRAMKGFRSRRFDILVATDIAARGLDISGVSHVINFDVPGTPEAYTHRIGRTGRSEMEGIASTFVTSGDHAWVRATENMIGAPIARRRVEGFDPGKPDPASKSPGRASKAAKASKGKPRRQRATAGPKARPVRKGQRRTSSRNTQGATGSSQAAAPSFGRNQRRGRKLKGRASRA